MPPAHGRYSRRDDVARYHSLSPTERRVLEQFVRLLEAELGADLRALWLYGSRARGEQPGPDSDVDLLVISTRRGSQDDLRVVELLMDAAEAEGANPASSPRSSSIPIASLSGETSGPSSCMRSTATRSCSSASREPALRRVPFERARATTGFTSLARRRLPI
jgi:predicted nucleotidyltransferase